MTLSDQLRHAIKKAGVSRYRISQETGVDQGALTRFCVDRRSINLDTADLLAEYLGIELRPRGRTKQRK